MHGQLLDCRCCRLALCHNHRPPGCDPIIPSVPTARPEEPGTRPPGSVWPSVVAFLLAFALCGTAAYLFFGQQAPLGRPVPPSPKPLLAIVTNPSDISLLHGKVSKGWLAPLAPQPDGAPPLRYHYISEKLGFEVQYPYAGENVQFDPGSFFKDAVDSQVVFRADQALFAIKVSLPIKDKAQSQVDYANGLLAQVKKIGAQTHDVPHEVELPGGTAVTLSYLRKNGSDTYVHRLYIVGMKPRAMVFDFMLRPEAEALGDKYAAKVMKTFTAGDMLSPLVEKPRKAVNTEPTAAARPTKP